MKHSNILVSVIMCVYNTKEEYLIEAVNSILNQTHQNFELFIVDDCSTQNLFTNEIFLDKRIVFLKTPVNSGAAVSRNLALDKAKGKYIAIMDSDDISLADRLSVQIDFMENNTDVVVCGTWFKHIGCKNNTVKRVIDDNDYYRCCLLFGNVPTLLNPSAMIRRDIIEKNHIRYDPFLRLAQDYGLWTVLSRYGRITILKKVLLLYRIHESQVTNHNYRSRQTLKYDTYIHLKQIEELGIVLTENEKNMLSMDYYDKRVKPIPYYNFLRSLLEANLKASIYAQDKLEKRVKEQWESKILNIKNLFLIIWMLLVMNGERKHILNLKFKQLFRKL